MRLPAASCIAALMAGLFLATTRAAGPEPGTKPSQWRFQEERLYAVPTGLRYSIASPDRRHLAMVAERDGKWAVCLDGVAGAGYDRLGPAELQGGPQSGPGPGIGALQPPIIFSPDGRRLAYEALKGQKVVAVVDGQDGSEFDSINYIQFSPDGKQVAYSASSAGQHRAVIDRRPQPPYDAVTWMRFSPTGKHFIYGAQKGQKVVQVLDGDEFEGEGGASFSPDDTRVALTLKKRNKWVVVVDGREGAEYAWITSEPRFTRDGRHLFYDASKDTRHVRVVDGVEGPDCDMFGMGLPTFSLDGKRVAYVVRRGQKHLVVVNGQTGPEYDEIATGGGELFEQSAGSVFNPDGSVAYLARKGQQWVLVVNGQEKAEYDGIGQRSDGTILAYAAKKGQKYSVVLDGSSGPEYDDIATIMHLATAGGRGVAYIASRNQQWFAVVDGRPSAAYDYIDFANVHVSDDRRVIGYTARRHDRMLVVANGVEGREYGMVLLPCFSPDGRHAAYWTSDGNKWVFVVDRAESSACDGISEGGTITLHPDGKHAASAAKKGDKQVVVVDQYESAKYDQVIPGTLGFRPDGTVEFLGIRQGAVWRGTARIVTGPTTAP